MESVASCRGQALRPCGTCGHVDKMPAPSVPNTKVQSPVFASRRRVQRLMQAPHLAAAPIQAGNLSTPCIVRPVNLGFFDSSPLKHAFCSAQLLGVDWSGDWKAEFTEFVRWLRDNYKEICKIFWQRLTSTWCTRNTSLITKMSYSECQIGHHNNILKAQTYFMILIF